MVVHITTLKQLFQKGEPIISFLIKWSLFHCIIHWNIYIIYSFVFYQKKQGFLS